MAVPITSKEDDARARRCFVEQFTDLDGTSAWNVFKDISALIFGLLVIEINHYASQKNDHLFTFSSSEIQMFVGLIKLSSYNSRRNFQVENLRVQSIHGNNEPIKTPADEIACQHVQ